MSKVTAAVAGYQNFNLLRGQLNGLLPFDGSDVSTESELAIEWRFDAGFRLRLGQFKNVGDITLDFLTYKGYSVRQVESLVGIIFENLLSWLSDEQKKIVTVVCRGMFPITESDITQKVIKNLRTYR